MRKLLYVILVLDIIGIAVSFIATLGTSFLVAIITLLAGGLGVIPLLAIIRNLEDIECLYDKVYSIKYDLDKLKPIKEDGEFEVDYMGNNETAKGTWECVKCNTVNKQGSGHCSNCGARYSSFQNPTTSPFAKKKLSRWIKK